MSKPQKLKAAPVTPSSGIIFILVQHKTKKIRAFKTQNLYNAYNSIAKVYQVGKINEPAASIIGGVFDPKAILFRIDLSNSIIPKITLNSSSSIIKVCDFIEENKCPNCYFEIGKTLMNKGGV